MQLKIAIKYSIIIIEKEILKKNSKKIVKKRIKKLFLIIYLFTCHYISIICCIN